MRKESQEGNWYLVEYNDPGISNTTQYFVEAKNEVEAMEIIGKDEQYWHGFRFVKMTPIAHRGGRLIIISNEHTKDN